MFRLGHLSDIHLGGVPPLRLRDYASKRIVGYANWRRTRSRVLRSGALERLVADLRAQQPNHIAVTGDLTNIATREEFENARSWLEELGPPDRVTAIPGNHDAYVPRAHQRFRQLWAPWMASDDAEYIDEALFPFMRRKGHVALIGVSSAVASAPFMATGRVGASQTLRLSALLKEAGEEGLFRVILIHHPPKLVDPTSAWRRLTDGRRFRRAVERHGAELILHGHEHLRMMTAIKGARGPVPVVGVPAGGSIVKGGPRAAGYALHEIAEGARAYELTVIHRSIVKSGEIAETARSTYSVSRR
ncbi:MAG: metallophosphoesterase family protein [Propylenella sp.]